MSGFLQIFYYRALGGCKRALPDLPLEDTDLPVTASLSQGLVQKTWTSVAWEVWREAFGLRTAASNQRQRSQKYTPQSYVVLPVEAGERAIEANTLLTGSVPSSLGQGVRH